ncbi:MAG: RNA polymerase sigma factor [Anaerolineales bacterium]|nr:RNA polymerase sigma factor [Anaerolineales bacterium]
MPLLPPQPLPEFDRARLVRLCAHFAGEPRVAEDLAQETLLEAWRNAHKLYDASGYQAWLAAIARNVCWRWRRRNGRELAHVHPEAEAESEGPAEAFDLEIDLERSELAFLLDRALALLPEATREVLVARYVFESPLEEIAGRLGVSEGNVAVRLHRGKLALRRLFNTELQPEVRELGLRPSPQLQTTRLWCPVCGQRRLEGRLNAQAGDLLLRCPECYAARGITFRHTRGLPQVLNKTRSIRAALTQLYGWSEAQFSQAPPMCAFCGRAIQPRARQTALTGTFWDCSCTACGGVNTIAVSNRVMASPLGQQFWKRHPRLRYLPERAAEAEGAAALWLGWESLTTRERLEVLVARETFQILRVLRND